MIYNLENTIEIGKRCCVTVDGTPVKYVVFADTEAGLVRAYDTDADGNCYVDPMTGELAIKEVRGAVVVTAFEPSDYWRLARKK